MLATRDRKGLHIEYVLSGTRFSGCQIVLMSVYVFGVARIQRFLTYAKHGAHMTQPWRPTSGFHTILREASTAHILQEGGKQRNQAGHSVLEYSPF